MYVSDSRLTAIYREVLLGLGFDPLHVALVQVDVTDRAGRADMPRCRITTGTEVMRRGERIRRTLMLWYVQDETAALAEARDLETMTSVMTDTFLCLPPATRAHMPPLPQADAAMADADTRGIARRAA